MSMIPFETFSRTGFPDSAGSICSRLLDEEIPEITTEYIAVKGPYTLRERGNETEDIILLILEGSGTFKSPELTAAFNQAAVARPVFGSEYAIDIPDGESCILLRISKVNRDEDIKLIQEEAGTRLQPFFMLFKDCPHYKEAIKSEKTINTTLFPEGIIPRVAIGAVETEGPDEVAAHTHPMLEQLFLGLNNCCCMVKADEASQLLEEDMLLHIPTGSEHQVIVEQGAKLYYIWMDFFQDMEGEKHLSNHIPIEE